MQMIDTIETVLGKIAIGIVALPTDLHAMPIIWQVVAADGKLLYEVIGRADGNMQFVDTITVIDSLMVVEVLTCGYYLLSMPTVRYLLVREGFFFEETVCPILQNDNLNDTITAKGGKQRITNDSRLGIGFA